MSLGARLELVDSLRVLSRKTNPTGPNFDKRMKAIRKKFKLGYDVLRHTFITFHVAKFKSVGATSLQAGNFEAIVIVRRHYLKVVAENEAKQFWGIKPET